MAEHYTRATVEVKKFCKQCNGFTMHNVLDGKIASCQGCMKKLDDKIEVDKKKRPVAVQDSLF